MIGPSCCNLLFPDNRARHIEKQLRANCLAGCSLEGADQTFRLPSSHGTCSAPRARQEKAIARFLILSQLETLGRTPHQHHWQRFGNSRRFAIQETRFLAMLLWFQTIISKWLWRTSPEFAENDAQFSIMIAREKKNNTHPCTKSKSLIVIAAGAVHFMPIGSARGESGDNTRKLHGPAILSTPCVSMPSSAMVGQVTPNVDPHRIPCVRDQLYALVELSRCRGKHILTSVLPCLE